MCEDTENHDETLCEDVVSKYESLLLFCAINSKVYGLFTNVTQSINDAQTEVTPHEDEDFDLIGLNVVDKRRNIFPVC